MKWIILLLVVVVVLGAFGLLRGRSTRL